MKKLDKVLSFKASSKEIDVLNKKIKGTSLTKSEFLRQSIFYTDVRYVDKEFQKRQLFLLNNIANNCNQLAKHCNIHKRVDNKTLDGINELLTLVKSIAKVEK